MKKNPTEKPELKPKKSCPFCRGIGEVHTFQITDDWVQCRYCGLSTKFFYTPEEAVNFWDKRAY